MDLKSIRIELENYSSEKWLNKSSEKLNYRLRAPDMINKKKDYPLLVYFHGSGGRGNDNTSQLTDAGAIRAFFDQQIVKNYSTYILAAQVPDNEKWVNVPWENLTHKMPEISKSMRLLFEILDNIIENKDYRINKNRVYTLGISMGGYAVWDAIQRRKDIFAAAVPICGGGDPSLCGSISSIPIWSWHGTKDEDISVQRSRDMHDGILNAGGNPKYTEVKERGHDVWLDVWREKSVWDWLFSKSL